MKCKFCGNPTRWLYTDNGGWYAAEMDGGWHACNGGKLLEPDKVEAVKSSVTVSDRWKADKFIKRMALYRYLYPRKPISYDVFIQGTDPDRVYLIRCSDKAFSQIMKTGKTGILQ